MKLFFCIDLNKHFYVDKEFVQYNWNKFESEFNKINYENFIEKYF